MKIRHIVLFFGLAFSFINAQISLEINSGMTVETTGSVYISGTSDVIENGTGYLKGVVESSVLTNPTQFAGLTLGTGFSGTITRTTGTALSSGSPKTAKRNYIFSTGSAVTDVTVNLVTSVLNDESNGIAEKYIYTKDGTTWKGYSDNGSTSSSIKAASVNIQDGTNLTVAEGVGIHAKIFLEGPYSGPTMTDNLGTLSFTSPYATNAPRTATSISANAVDWVLVEIRTGTTANTVVGYRSAFIDINGNIINDDDTDLATAGIGMPGVGGTPYYIVVKHRNHLGVMSNTAQTLSWMTP